MQIIVDQLLTQYEVSGTGRLVVLLHGWGDSSKGLAELQQRLAEHYQVLALDLPGFGGSQAPKGAWDLDNYAEFVAAVLAKLKLGQPYAVIGHSNGGALAIRAVSLQKLRPKKLVLLAAAGIRDSRQARRLIFTTLAKTGKLATFWLPAGHRQRLRRKLYGAAGSDIMVAPALEATFKKIVRQDVQADAAKITQPTLLIYGEDDRATPVSYGRIYERFIKNARLEIIPKTGHFVHLDDDAHVANLIEEFLA